MIVAKYKDCTTADQSLALIVGISTGGVLISLICLLLIIAIYITRRWNKTGSYELSERHSEPCN